MSDASGLNLYLLQKRLSLAALAATSAIAWWFLVASEQAMQSMAGDGVVMQLMWLMMAPQAVAGYLAAAALMWIVMMVAMMIPAVLPMAVVFRGIHRGAHADLDTGLFASGYLVAWSLFSLLAAGLQWGLHSSGALHGHTLASGPRLAAAILVAAGLYQLTPLKEACLARCRSPVSYFMEHWADGRLGAWRMGMHHGLYCIGCCWVLMLLMFAGGAMSVATMVALCVLILAERMLPAGPWVSRLPGVVMIAAGVGLALSAPTI